MMKTSLSLAALCMTVSINTAYAGNADGSFPVISKESNRLIITTDQSIATPNVLAQQSSLSRIAGTSVQFQRSMALSNRYVFELPNIKKGFELNMAIEKLENSPGIISVEKDVLLQPMSVNDPLYEQQWHYFEPTGGINLPQAWTKSTGANIYVAVLDTGIVYHPDLIDNLVGGYDFISVSSVANDGNLRDADPSDPGDWTVDNECEPGWQARSSSWHGTHVAGTIAAVTNNNEGIAGVAPDAKLVPVRVLGKCGGLLSDISDAIIWAAGGQVSGVPNNPYKADVINMSLGGPGSCSATYQAAINQAVNLGTTVVVAAGNSDANASGFSPASCNNVITVASNDRQGNRSFYSNYGAVVDVTAPGGETVTKTDGVLSTLNSGTQGPSSNNYDYYQGTSMAAPHVAGIAALMKSANTNASPAQIESALKSTTRPLPGNCSGGCGTGIVDATAAVNAIAGDELPPATDDDNSLEQNNLSANRGGWYFTAIEVPANARKLVVNISGGSGDADLYVRFGTNPTTTRFDCRPFINGNVETCTITNPAAGSWKLGLRGYRNFAGVTLKASWEK